MMPMKWVGHISDEEARRKAETRSVAITSAVPLALRSFELACTRTGTHRHTQTAFDTSVHARARTLPHARSDITTWHTITGRRNRPPCLSEPDAHSPLRLPRHGHSQPEYSRKLCSDLRTSPVLLLPQPTFAMPARMQKKTRTAAPAVCFSTNPGQANSVEGATRAHRACCTARHR